MRADRDRLVQVLWNLLSNAMKFSAAGGRITVGAAAHAGSVTLCGGGHRDRDRAGAPAARLPALLAGGNRHVAGYAGLGIGLALARHLVEMHGGEIAARSEGPGRGATFSVTLPARDPGPSGNRRGSDKLDRFAARP